MDTRTLSTCAALFAAGLQLSACAYDNKDLANKHAVAVERIVASTPAWIDRGKDGATLWSVEREFYQSRQNRTAWIEANKSTPRLDALVDVLRKADTHGLDPTRYGLSEVDGLLTASNGGLEPARVAELDTRLTYAYLRYAADLLGWSSTPRSVFRQWVVVRNEDDLAARLARAIASDQVKETLDELTPPHSQYAGLQAALASERAHPTGRLDQLRMNLERWRWMPHELGSRYVLVNVPAYQMQVVEQERPVLAMRVIVGKPENPTPLFSDEMTHLIFSPVWNVPESIIRKEMVPRLTDDPSYLMRHDIEVVQGSGKNATIVDADSVDWSDEDEVSRLAFRQAPVPENALGLVKFMFPNDFDVYLHDTPTESLFNRPNRAFSHGCVRVENPVGFAHYLLADQPEWTTDRIATAMNGRREQTVTLKEKLPVHIGYWTAWVNADGSVTYNDDPYAFDQKQAAVEHLTPPPVAAPTPDAAKPADRSR